MSKSKASDWIAFEHETRLLVEAFGYRAETTRPSHDFGVDVIAASERRLVVIPCKLYGRGSTGGEAMMKLVGSRTYFKATGSPLPGLPLPSRCARQAVPPSTADGIPTTRAD